MSANRNVLGSIGVVFAAAVFGGACNNDTAVVVLDGRIDTIDVNDDLVVSQAELNASFVVFDVNHDLVLDDAEFVFNAEAFRVLDVDANGLISEAEFDAAFDILDVNDDLLLEEAEFEPFL